MKRYGPKELPIKPSLRKDPLKIKRTNKEHRKEPTPTKGQVR